MFKKIVAPLLAMIVFIGGLSLTSITSEAVNYDYYVGYSQPTCNDKSGYFSVISSANGGSLYTYFWIFTGLSDSHPNASAEMIINVTSSRRVSFTPVVYPLGSAAWLTMGYYDQTGMLHMTNYGMVSGNTNVKEELFSYDIQGFTFGGNVTGFTNGYRDVPSPTIHWNKSADGQALNNKLNEVLTRLANLDVDTDVMINNLVNIYNQNITTQQKLDQMNALLAQIKSEQEETNSWLEKIFNNLQESPEKQKNEAQSQGNSSVSQGTSSIEDKGAGFANSMGGLVSSMSYSGTECAWTFPEVRLPAISGVMDSVTIIEEQPIDFTTWINAIPQPILLLIQSVLTMGLIVYCFKELYGAISYVLTLRGGGADE